MKKKTNKIEFLQNWTVAFKVVSNGSIVFLFNSVFGSCFSLFLCHNSSRLPLTHTPISQPPSRFSFIFCNEMVANFDLVEKVINTNLFYVIGKINSCVKQLYTNSIN